MQKNLLIYYILLSIILLVSCEKENYHTDSPTDYDNEILVAINAHRATIGLKPFVHDDFIWQKANEHSENMANGLVPFGHDGLTERSNEISVELGNGNIAENVASGQGTAEEIVKSWLAGAGHKINIEGDFTLTGISAIKIKNGTYYYTELFYKKNP